MHGLSRAAAVVAAAMVVAALAPCGAEPRGDDTVVVQTSLGPVRGVRGGAGGAGDLFRGIRYGVVPQRFGRAEPAPAWAPDTLNATAFGPACMQNPQGVKPGTALSEDCLFINVFRSPAARVDGASLPVMYWIHGGAFQYGATHGYNFSALAASQQVVVVSVEYRLGPFGFLTTDASGADGLNGVGDQIMGLQWVHDHISSFGGDPTQVTVFGQSAGSMSTSIVAVSPLAKGLVHRAIGESGASTAPVPNGVASAAAGWAYSDWFVQHWMNTTLEELRNRTAFPAELVQYPYVLDQPKDAPQLVTTTVDGWVLPASTRSLYSSGALNVEAYMLGFNTFDGLAYLLYKTRPDVAPSTPEEFNKVLLYLFKLRARQVFTQYDPARYNNDTKHAFAQLYGDLTFVCPIKNLLGELSRQLPGKTFGYVFGHLYASDNSVDAGIVSLSGRDAVPWWASHGGEIPFMLDDDTVYSTGVTTPFTEAENRLSSQIQGYWGSFARGDTNPMGVVAWPPVRVAQGSPPQPAQVQQLLFLGTGANTTHVADSWHDEQCESLGIDPW